MHHFAYLTSGLNYGSGVVCGPPLPWRCDSSWEARIHRHGNTRWWGRTGPCSGSLWGHCCSWASQTGGPPECTQNCDWEGRESEGVRGGRARESERKILIEKERGWTERERENASESEREGGEKGSEGWEGKGVWRKRERRWREEGYLDRGKEMGR